MRRRRHAASMAGVLPTSPHPGGLAVAVLAGGAATGGRYAVAELRGPRAADLPLHVHEREDECLLVLDGALELRGDGARETLAAGAAAHLPRRRPHGLRVVSARAVFLQLWTPAGFEETLGLLSGPAPDPDDVAALLAGAGVTLLERR